MAIILGILAGIGLPIQTGINTTLRKKWVLLTVPRLCLSSLRWYF